MTHHPPESHLRHRRNLQHERGQGEGPDGAVTKRGMLDPSKRAAAVDRPVSVGIGGAGDPSSDSSSSSSSSTRGDGGTGAGGSSSTPSSSSSSRPQGPTSSSDSSSSSSDSASSSSSSQSSSNTSTNTNTATTSSTTQSTATTALSTTSTTSSRSTTSTSTTSLTTSTSSTSSTVTTHALVTSFVTASPSFTSSNTASLASSTSGSSSSSPSAGTVVGIVAGALVGVVVLSGIIGYFFRTKCRNSKDEDYIDNDYDGTNPFGSIDNAYGGNGSRGDLRRDSHLLMDDDDGQNSVHQMSELGHDRVFVGGDSGMAGSGIYANAAPVMAGVAAGAAGAYALNRSPTSTSPLPGLARADTVNPRPPTMIQRHYAHQQAQGLQGPPPAMPSFQPGQIVNAGAYFPSNQSNQSGPYPSFPPTSIPVGGYVQRGPSTRDISQLRTISPENTMYANVSASATSELPHRSGTPEFSNPQQYFHSLQDSDVGNSAVPSPARDLPMPGQASMYGDHGAASGSQGYGASDVLESYSGTPAGQNGRHSDEQAKTLIVRNGNVHDIDIVRDSVYGGM